MALQQGLCNAAPAARERCAPLILSSSNGQDAAVPNNDPQVMRHSFGGDRTLALGHVAGAHVAGAALR
jgi:hypothetical protein